MTRRPQQQPDPQPATVTVEPGQTVSVEEQPATDDALTVTQPAHVTTTIVPDPDE